MATNKRTRGNPIPLIREDHPEDYTGYPFITLLQYQRELVLTIVDDSDEKRIRAFVLDMCGPASVDEELLIEVAVEWFENSADIYPFSFELSRRGMTGMTSTLYRSYNIEFITRVIGPLPKFKMNKPVTIKRRRRKPIPPGVEVRQANRSKNS